MPEGFYKASRQVDPPLPPLDTLRQLPAGTTRTMNFLLLVVIELDSSADRELDAFIERVTEKLSGVQDEHKRAKLLSQLVADSLGGAYVTS